ncbi:HIT domain-containing protein [Brevundimonas kwangchunensis]|uniref:HIT domain-containing protein n=1 Tax=Brevundimonas kwangchunensis TaxID=322163 RepID=A0ABN1GKU6_9CAUL
MSTSFRADPAFDAGSVVVCDWPLCQVRLQDDARFPWLILIPRGEGLHELEDLSAADRAVLMEEIVRAGEIVRELGETAFRPVQKLNVAAIGNVTAQLHVHVVGRRHDDGLWPDPVWGKGPAQPYGSALQAAVSRVRLSPAG